MINSLTKLYEGNDVSGATPNVVYLPIVKNGTIVSIDVKTDLNVSGADAVFSVSKNGAVISGLSPTIAVGAKIGSLTGLTIAVAKGDEIILNLVSGAVSTPITLNVESDDGVSGGSLPSGDLNASTNKLEKIQTIPLVLPASLVGKNGNTIKYNEFTNQFELWAIDTAPTLPLSSLPSGLPYWAAYEAFREIGYRDTDAVPTMVDQSGNARNATQTNNGYRPIFRISQINGLPAFDFTINRFFNLPNMSALTELELFYIVKADNDPNTDNQGGLDNVGTAGGGYSTTYPFSDGNCYMGNGSSLRRNTGNPTQNLAVYHCLDVISTTAEWTMKLNGTTHYTTGSNTVSCNSAPTLGRAADVDFRGRIAGAYYFTSKLTVGQLATFRTYLTDIFGISFA